MKRKWTAILLAFSLLICLALTGCSKVSTYQEAKNGVVFIGCRIATVDGQNVEAWRGSGFFVGKPGEKPEYLITNHHVVDCYLLNGSGEWVSPLRSSEAETYGQPIFYEDGTPVEGKAYLDVYFDEETSIPASVVTYNEVADVAILRLNEPTDLRIPLNLMEPTENMVGQSVYLLGFPGHSDNPVVDTISKKGLQDMSVTTGALSRMVTQAGSGIRILQTDAKIQGGNSGGPMVNAKGQVIGINTFSVGTGENQDNYAVNIAETISLLKQYNIPYQVGSDGLPMVVIVAIALATAGAAAAVIIVLLKRKGKAKAVPAPIPASPSASAEDSGFRLQCTSGTLEGRRFMIRTDGTLSLGRNSALCNIAFPENTPGVSGQHCALWYNHGRLYLKDLGSSHGTFLSGKMLAANQPVEIRVGSSFYLGSPRESFVISDKRGS